METIDMTVKGICNANYARLGEIHRIERGERALALDIFQSELRRMWQVAPSRSRFDRYVREVTRVVIRDAYTEAVSASLVRADNRHQAADRMRSRLLAAISDVLPRDREHAHNCAVPIMSNVKSSWLACACYAASRVALEMVK